jgi:hypothetical protein
MIAAEHQVVDVNHYDNTIIVKYEDGTVRMLNGAEVRRGTDEPVASGVRTELGTAAMTDVKG